MLYNVLFSLHRKLTKGAIRKICKTYVIFYKKIDFKEPMVKLGGLRALFLKVVFGGS